MNNKHEIWALRIMLEGYLKEIKKLVEALQL